LALGVIVKAFDRYTVTSASMEPTLHCSGNVGCSALTPDQVVVSRWSYLVKRPRRQDIVLIELDRGGRIAGCGKPGPLLKRLVALPGDTISTRGGRLYVNGRLEVRVAVRRLSPAPVQLAEDEYFVLGDNRRASCDSRAFGAISRSEIKGEVVVRFAGQSGFRFS
jgi:signal peptidase I